MDRVIIVAVNGKPRSGKTTIQELLKLKAMEYNINVTIKSSVEHIYEVYKLLGWNGIKDDTFRNNMNILKQMYIDNCNGPTRDIISYAVSRIALNDKRPDIIFYDVREMAEIEKLKSVIKPLNAIGIYCKTLLVRRPEVEDIKYGNSSDNIENNDKDYDIVIYNDGLLSDLSDKISDLKDTIIGGI